MKSVFLKVYGDGDSYAGVEFGRQYRSAEVYERMLAEGVQEMELDEGIYVEIVEFGPVDPDFLHYVLSEFGDYDGLKHSTLVQVK